MDITAEIIADFREFYPEFAEPGDSGATVTFADSFLTRFLCEADEETGPRWGSYNASACSLKKRGMFAYAAHKAVLAKAVARATAAGAIAAPPSRVASKSVGDESVSYAVAAPGSSGEAAQAGDLNTTSYGLEFMRLRKRAGAGPVVV